MAGLIRKLEVGVMVLLVTVVLVSCSKEVKSQSDEETKRVIHSGVVSNYVSLGKAEGSSKYYIIRMNDRTSNYFPWVESIPAIYAIDIDLRYEDRNLNVLEFNKYVSQKTWEKFNLNLYSIQSGELVKTIDVKKLLEMNHLNVQYAGLSSIATLSHNKVPYFTLRIENRPETVEQAKTDTERCLYIDLEHEKLYEANQGMEQIGYPVYKEEAIFYYSTLLQDNGLKDHSYIFSKEGYWEGTYSINVEADSILAGAKLYDMFPGLELEIKDILKKGGEPWIKIYLVDNPTPEEMLDLFLPKDQKIVFDNIKVPSEISIDGKEHPVSSFEEYEKYLKPLGKEPAEDSPIYTMSCDTP